MKLTILSGQFTGDVEDVFILLVYQPAAFPILRGMSSQTCLHTLQYATHNLRGSSSTSEGVGKIPSGRLQHLIKKNEKWAYELSLLDWCHKSM